jgi:hypothetical protein
MSAHPVWPFRLLVAAGIFLAFAGSARADTINFAGNRGSTSNPASDPVSFSGSLEVVATSTTSATLKITLDNTTSVGDAVQYGFITGFGFNLPTGITATNTTTGSPFFLLNAASHSTSLQGGEFDYAFSLSSSQLHTVNSGVINQGIDAGDAPATFTANLSGAGAGALTAAQIMAELSAPTAVPFSVRFRSTNPGTGPGQYQGLNDPDGDKVPVSSVTQPPKPVPAPPGIVLAGVGFGALLLGRLRFRRKTAAQA